jgi:hypothetical protein
MLKKSTRIESFIGPALNFQSLKKPILASINFLTGPSELAFSGHYIPQTEVISHGEPGSDAKSSDAMRCEEFRREAMAAVRCECLRRGSVGTSMPIKPIRPIRSGVTIRMFVRCPCHFVLLSWFASLQGVYNASIIHFR